MDRLDRIERLQQQLHALSIWRLTSVTREREKLAAAQRQMIEALGEGLMAYGGPAAAGARRIRALERDLALARILESDLGRQTAEHGARSKLADRAAVAARNAYRDSLDRKSLEELIAATLPAPSGSGKG